MDETVPVLAVFKLLKAQPTSCLLAPRATHSKTSRFFSGRQLRGSCFRDLERDQSMELTMVSFCIAVSITQFDGLECSRNAAWISSYDKQTARACGRLADKNLL